MDPAFEAQLREGGLTFTPADAALLRAIDEEGSLNAAASSLGRSYSRAQKRLTALEEGFGTLVARTRGGSGGGGSRLTEAGRDLLSRFERLETGYSSIAEVAETVLEGEVVERDGELALVETGAGRILALVPPEVESVQVSIRADAVTLHAPADAPPAGGTSARNRFEGTVTSIDRGESIAQVAVEVGAESPLLAILTHDSLERLELEPGSEIVASFKAAATRCARQG